MPGEGVGWELRPVRSLQAGVMWWCVSSLRAGQHIFISTNDTDWSSSAATNVLMDHSNISDPASRHESYKVCSNKSYQDGAAHHHYQDRNQVRVSHG